MPSVISYEKDRSETAEQPKRNGKNLATLNPSVASEDAKADPGENGIRHGRNGNVAWDVACRCDQLEPSDQQEQCTCRPGAKPLRIAKAQRKPIDPWPRHPLDKTENCRPGVDQRPNVTDEGGDKAQSNPPDNPNGDRGDVLERILVAEQAGADDQG